LINSNTPLVRNITILASGTVLAQIVSILSSPFITRIFTPDLFGYFGVFMSILVIPLSFSTLTFSQAIVIPKRDIISTHLVLLSYLIALGVSFISFIGFYFFSENIAMQLNILEIKNYLIYIPLFVLIGASIQIHEQMLIRKQKFKIISKITVIQTLIENTMKIVAGYMYPAVFILILSTFISRAYNSISMIRSVEKIQFSAISIVKIQYVIRRFKDFPLYRAPQQFLSSISHGAPVLLLTYYFSPIVTGYFILADRIIKTPISILSQSVSKVYLKHISDLVNNNKNVYQSLKKSTLVLGLIGLFPTSIILIFGPELFSIVFGSNWHVSGVYAQYLIISLFISFMTSPSIQYLTVSDNQKYILKWEIVTTLLKVSSIIAIGSFYNEPKYTILAYSIVGAFTCSLLIFKAFSISNQHNKEKTLNE
jgi:O-antigen/teichoic acid export membrane protein